MLLDLKMPGEKGAASLSGSDRPHVSAQPASGHSRGRRFGERQSQHDPPLPQSRRRPGSFRNRLPVDQIRAAVKTVLDGGVWFPDEVQTGDDDELGELAARLATLTPQQVRVLSMLGQGLLNKQIAFELSVSEATVKAHVSAILQKLGVDSRTQAVIAVNRIAAVDGHGDEPAAFKDPKN